MKKIYEVRVETVDAYMGYRNGDYAAGYTLDAGKAEELKNRVVADLLAKGGWWMTVAKNNAGEPDVHVVELGEVWE
jgi:hypothetical protein